MSEAKKSATPICSGGKETGTQQTQTVPPEVRLVRLESVLDVINRHIEMLYEAAERPLTDEDKYRIGAIACVKFDVEKLPNAKGT